MKKFATGMFIVLASLPQFVVASIPAVYTNDNFYTSTHDTPVSLFQYATGGFYGYTETGKFYEQLPVANDYGVRMHRFAIDEAYFYVTDRGTIDAESDLAAISIYFSRGA